MPELASYWFNWFIQSFWKYQKRLVLSDMAWETVFFWFHLKSGWINWLKAGKKLNAIFAFWLISSVILNFDKIKCILSRKTREIQWKQYFSSFRDFSGGFECVLVPLLLIQTHFSMQFYIRRMVILSSIRRYDYVLCRVNRFRVMIDFLRDDSACPVFCKTLPYSCLNGGHVWNVSHDLYQITHESFSTSEKSIKDNCSSNTSIERWNRLLW